MTVLYKHLYRNVFDMPPAGGGGNVSRDGDVEYLEKLDLKKLSRKTRYIHVCGVRV